MRYGGTRRLQEAKSFLQRVKKWEKFTAWGPMGNRVIIYSPIWYTGLVPMVKYSTPHTVK